MGTKRPFDEDFQGFIKHPKHIENGTKLDLFGEEKLSFEPSQSAVIIGEGGEKVTSVPNTVETVFETSTPIPLLTSLTTHEEASEPGPSLGFCPGLFSDIFEFHLPSRPLIHHDDTYSPLLNCTPRKEVPIGPHHEANVPDFNPDSAKNYTSNNGREGICVISNQEDETVITQTECKCLDNGSIRCIQQHVNEARVNLKQSLGVEKFISLGFGNMGEEVAGNWTEEEEQRFQDVIYSNPVSHGKKFWEVLSVEFPTRSKKELVSYYFNVFIYRRRAVQNRSHLLAIDSDDDEWWGSKNDFIVVRPDSSSEDGDDVTGVNENVQENVHENQVGNIRVEKITSENVVSGNSFGSRSESYLHWDPPYSTMGSTKGVDLLPTCSMIEEIFGTSKTSKST